MLTLRVRFDQGQDPLAALATIRFGENTTGLRLQGDLLHVPTDNDHNFLFGRHLSSDVCFYRADQILSWIDLKHLQIEVTSQACYVRDLASKNGTRHNERWLGGPPPRRSSSARTPSGRQKLQAGDVIWLPGLTLTVIEVPAVPLRPVRANPSSPVGEVRPVGEEFAGFTPVLRLPPVVVFQSAGIPGVPPMLAGFKFVMTMGGKPAVGLTYLYERADASGPGGERWVVKYFTLPPTFNSAPLRHLLSRFFSVESVALHQACACNLAPGGLASHFCLCFPDLRDTNLTRSPLLDLAGIFDVLSGSLAALAELHRHGLEHGHVCAANIFLDAAGRVCLTDGGLNSLRSLIGAELTAPPSSARLDLQALGDLCLDLLGESCAAPKDFPAGTVRDPKQSWPGLPLQALAIRLRQEPELTAGQALQLLQGVPRPQVNRLLTVPRWGS